MPDLRFNDKKINAQIYQLVFQPEEYINIEANTKKDKSILIKNTNYMFRFILSKQKTEKELKSVKLSQVNFDLYSEKFMGGIVNIYTSRNNLNNNILPEMPVVVHIGLSMLGHMLNIRIPQLDMEWKQNTFYGKQNRLS